MEFDILVHILDGREKATNLPFALLKSLTENFSEDRLIGQGGFAKVYKGILPSGSVAVKRIMNNHTIDEKLFYREVDSLWAINHHNVVRFLGFCASTEQTAIKIEGSRQHIYAEIRERLLCFEYISNGSLQNHITDELRGLEWNMRYEIIKGICEGLHHLHKEKHIYHMDLKPANILLDDYMVPKITDFGLSRLDEKSQTMSEDRCGSLRYCAPEYRHSGKMSFKSDMFSLGIIITELVTGGKGIPDNDKNNVLRRWRHRWKKTGKETPLAYQQVAKCMEIGLLCQEIDPSKRPFIWDMIHDIRAMDGVNGSISNSYEYTFGQISPYSEDDMLGVEPLELHFPFELNKQISCSLKLTNQTDAYVAFNVETMSPLAYCTKPNKDVVPPRSKCSVEITLQAQDKVPRHMQREEEFIVWSTKVDDSLAAENITTHKFSKENGAVDAVKLDVVFYAGESTSVSDGLAFEDIAMGHGDMIMKENSWFELGSNSVLTSQHTVRHLTILRSWDRDKIVFESANFSQLRSLTVFGEWESFFISKSMRLLRVLDLECASCVKQDDLSKMLKLLCHLRYLSLRGRREICYLPSSLGGLSHLETLDVRQSSIVTLPESIASLKNLRCILADAAVQTSMPHPSSSWLTEFCISYRLVGIVVPSGIGKLTALHTLGVINIGASDGKYIMKDTKKLTKLRKLGVSGINRHNCKYFFADPGHVHLESLLVRVDKDNQDCLDDISLPWENLQSLKLYGLQDKLPLSTSHLSKLTKLVLVMDSLKKNDIEFLANLPELCILRLRLKQFEDDKLHFYAELYGVELLTFKKLKILEIACSSGQSLNVTFGSKSMKNLELIKVDCAGASYWFNGLNNLSELKQVQLRGADEDIKAVLEKQLLENHPETTPAVKLEPLPRSS